MKSIAIVNEFADDSRSAYQSKYDYFKTIRSKDQTTIVHVESGKITLLVRSPPSILKHTFSNCMLKTGGMSMNSAMTAGLPGSGTHENLFMMQFELPKRTKKNFTEADGLVMRVIGSIIKERIEKYIVLDSS